MSGRAAAEVIAVVTRQPDALIICPTGGTPTELYRLLADHERRHSGFFSRVRILGLDEWGGLGNDLSGSCRSYLNKHVLGPLRISRSQLFDPEADDPEQECRRIARWLKDEGPADLCLLGVGTNGHLGLNEPAERMEPFAHRAVLSPGSLKHPMLGGRVPAGLFGMTLGMRDILRSSQIVCLWGGDGKAGVFEPFRKAAVSARLPVSLLRTHPHAWILTDRTKVPAPL
jgi:galactosamine-6-phosphate isomerase